MCDCRSNRPPALQERVLDRVSASLLVKSWCDHRTDVQFATAVEFLRQQVWKAQPSGVVYRLTLTCENVTGSVEP